MKTYEVTLSNIVTAADNPKEAIIQFCILHSINLDDNEDTIFNIKECDENRGGYKKNQEWDVSLEELEQEAEAQEYKDQKRCDHRS